MQPNDTARLKTIFAVLSIALTFSVIYWAFNTIALSNSAILLITVLASIPLLCALINIFKGTSGNWLISFSGIFLLLLFMETGIRIAMLLGVPVPGNFRKAVPGNALQMPFYNRETATYDSISGFRWDTIPTSVMKISDGRIEYQNTFKGNNYGYHAAKNFNPEISPGTYRILVLGDSFTDAFFLDNPWPEQVEKELNKNRLTTEVYSFAVNGGGIVNWHNIFFKQIAPVFEFDMIILAIFGNDLDRDFFVMHHKNNLASAMYFQNPPSINEFESTFNSTPGLPVILSSNDFRETLQYFNDPVSWHEPDFLTLNYLHQVILNVFSNKDQSPDRSGLYKNFIYTDVSGEVPSFRSINEKYGSKKLLMLEDIVTFVKKHNKEILFLCIPEQVGAQLTAKGDQVQISLELEVLADHWGLPYLDGYRAYHGVNDSIVPLHFMFPDGHWNQEGSDHFVRHVVPFISRTISSATSK